MPDGATEGLVYFMKKFIGIASGTLSLLSLLACAAILSVFLFRTYRHDTDTHVDLKRLAASGVASVEKINALLSATEILTDATCIRTAKYGYYCKIGASSADRSDFAFHGYNVEVRHDMAYWYDSEGSLRVTSRF